MTETPHGTQFTFPTQATTPGMPPMQQQWRPAAPGRRGAPPGPAVLHAHGRCSITASFKGGEGAQPQAAQHHGGQQGHGGVRPPSSGKPREQTRLRLFMQIAERAGLPPTRSTPTPGTGTLRPGPLLPGISVPRPWHRAGTAGERIAGETIALSPRHVEARIALGTFHAEVIDKVGRWWAA